MCCCFSGRLATQASDRGDTDTNGYSVLPSCGAVVGHTGANGNKLFGTIQYFINVHYDGTEHELAVLKWIGYGTHVSDHEAII